MLTHAFVCRKVCGAHADSLIQAGPAWLSAAEAERGNLVRGVVHHMIGVHVPLWSWLWCCSTVCILRQRLGATSLFFIAGPDSCCELEFVVAGALQHSCIQSCTLRLARRPDVIYQTGQYEVCTRAQLRLESIEECATMSGRMRLRLHSLNKWAVIRTSDRRCHSSVHWTWPRMYAIAQ